MELSNFQDARKVLFMGASAVMDSKHGQTGEKRGLAPLLHTWAVCEWHLGNLDRAETLLGHALKLVETGERGSWHRSNIYYSMARLKLYREEFHLAQHFVGLILVENSTGGGNGKVWELWAEIAQKMGQA